MLNLLLLALVFTALAFISLTIGSYNACIILAVAGFACAVGPLLILLAGKD